VLLAFQPVIDLVDSGDVKNLGIAVAHLSVVLMDDECAQRRKLF